MKKYCIKTLNKHKLSIVGGGVPKGITDLYSHIRSNNSEMPDDPQERHKYSNKLMSNIPTSNAAITLIALIITIIVLLILSGVTIGVTVGDNGILEKANDAKEKSHLLTVEEIIRQEVLANDSKATSGINTVLDKEELKKEISKRLQDEGYTVIDNNTVKYYGDKEIYIENYLEDDNETYIPYNVGDVVTIGDENFYVLKASGVNEEKVTLLAVKNIDTSTKKQSNTANTIYIANTNYWKNETQYPLNLNEYESAEIKSTDAIPIAKAYGVAKGGTGRLMTLEEAREIENNQASSNIINNNTTYWLGTAANFGLVWEIEADGTIAPNALQGREWTCSWSTSSYRNSKK